ncbi:NADH-ubiquinone oxidoreductase-F iron-sulfur binding region domain-containing protein [Tindallia californiensis]|uniref:NADH-quinone oxidoreductase subunit F n=1 Tax=Tindallia californiensis TaxID=159292 RepID=A0A1H3LUJ0_9FIRM|nr:NADH-ubiquinone oxidoreductase-F iron-sulfur binding region domain-containing protein [Tindallia californiensis]SDY67668.1 NADH-quinone oxidoreductase subunit F [Tindallia californiensis]
MENALWLNERELTSVEKISRDASNDGVMSDYNFPGYEIISEIMEAGLKSRDGRGESVGHYMKTLSMYEGAKSITTSIVHSKMDEMLALQNPYSLILGMYLSAKATLAEEITLFVSKENQFIAQMLNMRIRQLEKMGYFKSYQVCFSVHVLSHDQIHYTQDISLLTNYRENLSQARSPYRDTEDIWETKKHFISNVETFLNISLVIRNGSQWYRSSGKEGNAGSKIFYVEHKGEGFLMEVDMGSTLREMMEKVSEKMDLPHRYALQIGGDLGGFISHKELDLVIDDASFQKAGLLLGSGVAEVISEESEAKKTLRSALRNNHKNSCGRCSVCREGIKRLGDLLETENQNENPQNREKISYLGNSIRHSALCGYGKTAINLIVTAADNHSFDYSFGKE